MPHFVTHTHTPAAAYCVLCFSVLCTQCGQLCPDLRYWTGEWVCVSAVCVLRHSNLSLVVSQPPLLFVNKLTACVLVCLCAAVLPVDPVCNEVGHIPVLCRLVPHHDHLCHPVCARDQGEVQQMPRPAHLWDPLTSSGEGTLHPFEFQALGGSAKCSWCAAQSGCLLCVHALLTSLCATDLVLVFMCTACVCRACLLRS